MKHPAPVPQKQAVEADDVEILPLDRDNPGDEYVYAEINSNRKKERWLVLYGLVSLALVAVLITIRLVFFT